MLNQLTISELAAKLARREVSAREAMQSCLDQIARVDGKIHAFISHDAADALAQADAADKLLAQGGRDASRPLLGVPVAIKDVHRRQKSAAQLRLENPRQVHFALRRDGRRKIEGGGRDRFWPAEHGRICDGQLDGKFRVRRHAQSVGHRRGFRAARPAARRRRSRRMKTIAALGSDTGGSIRQPAALCGCVGLKPTYGRVSRYGLVAFASSLDQIGPFTKDVRDAAMMLGVIGGHDARDSTSVPQPVPDYAAALTGDIKGLKLGLPKEYMIGGLDAEVKAAVDAAVKQFEKLGAEIVEISLPHTDYAVATYYIIATAEASANLARFDGIRYGARVDGADPIELYGRTRGAGFGAEVKRRIILGTYVLSSGYYDAYYLRAQKVRTLIRNDFLKAFEKVDAIVTPTSPTAAFKIGEKSDDPLQMYLSDIFTISCNLAGICGISLPCGFTQTPETAHRPAIAGQAVRRGNALENRPRLRTGHALAPGEDRRFNPGHYRPVCTNKRDLRSK